MPDTLCIDLRSMGRSTLLNSGVPAIGHEDPHVFASAWPNSHVRCTGARHCISRLIAVSWFIGSLIAIPSCAGTCRESAAKVAPSPRSDCQVPEKDTAPTLSRSDERELRAQWPEQLNNVWFSAPVRTSAAEDYVKAGSSFVRYLWSDDAECAPAYLNWSEGRADGYFVVTRWQEDGREYRKVRTLQLIDGALAVSTGYDIQTLDEDLFWSTVSTIGTFDGGYQIPGVFSSREEGVSFFAGVSARIKFRCDEGDCSQCNLHLYVAQLRRLPWSFESPSPDSVPGLHPSRWARNCERELPQRMALLVKSAELSQAWQLRTDRRPTALYASIARCQKDARPPDPEARIIAELPSFDRVRVQRSLFTPLRTLMSTAQRLLTAEQTAALLSLFSEKDVFTGEWLSVEGKADVVSFEFLDREGQLIRDGVADVFSDCTGASHAIYGHQKLSELGQERCRHLLKVVGPLELDPVDD